MICDEISSYLARPLVLWRTITTMHLVQPACPHEWLCPTFMNDCPTLLPSATTLPPSWVTLSHLHDWLPSSWMTLSDLHEWLSPPPLPIHELPSPTFMNDSLPTLWTTFFASKVLCMPHCKNNWQCAYHTIMINIHLFFCMKNPPPPTPIMKRMKTSGGPYHESPDPIESKRGFILLCTQLHQNPYGPALQNGLSTTQATSVTVCISLFNSVCMCEGVSERTCVYACVLHNLWT